MIDRSKLHYYSGDKADQIIGIFEGTINVGAPTSVQGYLSVTDLHAHTFGDSVYFRGRFTVDGGITWNDYGSQTPILTGSFPTFQTADCNAAVDTQDVKVKATSWYDNANSIGHAYTFQYELFAIAKNNMAAPITPIATKQKLSLYTKDNYEKIAYMDSVPISVVSGDTGGPLVTHELNKIPTVRAWFFSDDEPSICKSLIPDYTNQKYTQIIPQVTTQDVRFYVDAGFFSQPGAKGTIEYRIYYD